MSDKWRTFAATRARRRGIVDRFTGITFIGITFVPPLFPPVVNRGGHNIQRAY